MISDDGNDKDDNDDEDDEYDSGIFTDQNVQKLHRINQRKGHWLYSGEYSGEVEHPDRLILNTLTVEIEQAFRRN